MEMLYASLQRKNEVQTECRLSGISLQRNKMLHNLKEKAFFPPAGERALLLLVWGELFVAGISSLGSIGGNGGN